VEVAIVRDDAPLAPGERGEVMVKSPATTRGYFRNPEETRRLQWRDGYIRTGDQGYRDGDGDLYITGRTKSIIIQAGRNIAPQEVEESVDPLPFVRRSAGIGIDRGRIEGEQVYVFAEIRAGEATTNERRRAMVVAIVNAVHGRLGFRPGRVYLLAPRAIPMTYNGKLQHALLKQRYLEGTLRAKGQLLFPDY
jgi:fatty-acyl-CoA synthase